MPIIPPLKVESMAVMPSDAAAVIIKLNRAISETEIGQLRGLLDNWLAFALPAYIEDKTP